MADRHTDNLRTRFRFAVRAAGLTVTDAAAAAHVTERHLLAVLAGDRPMVPRLEDALRAAVGEERWRYVVGEAETLIVGAPSEEEEGPEARRQGADRRSEGDAR